MATRTVNISLLEQNPQVRTLKFTPDLASVDGDVLIEKRYTVTTDANGDATVALPVKASGSLRYDYEIPKGKGMSTGYFVLSAGSAISLDTLIAAGGVASDSTIEYVDEQIADAAIAAESSADERQTGWCLEFDSAKSNFVSGGPFFASDATAYDNDFFLQIKAKPGLNADNGGRYMFCTSRSGNHVVMFGFNDVGSGYLQLVAYHNANNVSCSSFDIYVKSGEWHEFALGLRGCTTTNDGTYSIYIDGICVGQQAKTTSRTGNSQYQNIYVGGNEHSTFNGRIAQLALYEGANQFPMLYSDGFYIPKDGLIATATGYSGQMKASLLYDFTRKSGNIIPDLSAGFRGTTHAGILNNGADDASFSRDISNYARHTVGDDPVWTYDPVALSAHNGTAIPAQEANAISQDYFTRANATYEDGRNTGLGTTEYGSKTWVETGAAWGILENWAFAHVSGGGTAKAVQDVGQTLYSIEFTPSQTLLGTYGASADVIFRYQDASNFYRVLCNGGDGYGYLYRTIGGVESLVSATASTVFANGWLKAKITLKANGDLELRKDGSNTVLKTWSALPSFGTATKVGMMARSSLYKFKKFVVYAT